FRTLGGRNVITSGSWRGAPWPTKWVGCFARVATSSCKRMSRSGQSCTSKRSLDIPCSRHGVRRQLWRTRNSALDHPARSELCKTDSPSFGADGAAFDNRVEKKPVEDGL